MTIEQEQTLKQQFVDQAFSKKWKEKLQSKNFSDKELINYCLDKAWRDAIIFVRMRTRAEDTEILSNQDAIKGAIYNSIVNREWGDDFDRWHDEVCKKEGNGMRYGVWQKFINMSFKYLYCINDQLNKSLGIDFAKCHLPLDDNTLLWCRNNNITQVKAWNSIERGEYLKIRDWVKAFIQKNPNDFEGALQLDFIVWRIKKICDVLNSIKNLKDDMKGLDNCRDWFADCGCDINDTREAAAIITETDALRAYIKP